jgi:hypothetical protein
MFNGASTVSPSWGRSSANNGVITCYYYSWLVVSNIWIILHNGIILPIDELIFFKVVKATDQMSFQIKCCRYCY